MHFFTGKDVAEHTINGDRPGERDKGIEDYIHIVVSKTENIYQGEKLDEHISLQIIPPGIIRGKKTSVFVFIATLKNIEEVV
jgi:hypothetical protein